MGLEIAGFDDLVEIGRGGFGVVYRARQTALDRTVAIKVMSAEALDPEVLRRFEREARILGQLSEHPNIVTVHDSGTTADGRPWVAMAYLPSGSLADRLAGRGPFAAPEATSIGIRIGGALETAHRAGIFHRDVKPENILVTSYGDPALADFGIARMSGGTQTVAGVVTASLTHAAPEVLDGAPPAAAGDVYALASTIFTLLNGRPAFDPGPDGGVSQMVAAIVSKPVPDLASVGVPAALSGAVRVGMAKDPAERPASAAEFAALLVDVAGGEGWPATAPVVLDPPGPGEAAGPPTAATPTPVPDDATRVHAVSGPRGRATVPTPERRDEAPDGPGPEVTPPPARRGMRPAVVLVGLGVVAALVVGALLLRGDGAQDVAAGTFTSGPNSGEGRVVFTVDLDDAPVAMATDGLGLYVATESRIEGRTLEGGIVRWATPRGVPGSEPFDLFAVAGAVVFADGDDVVALDATSGAEVSRFRLDGQPTTPHVTEQGVLLAVAGPSIARVEIDGGAVWRVDKPLAPDERYVVHEQLEGLPVIVTTDFEVLAIEPDSGEVLWAVTRPGDGEADRVLVAQGNDLVFTAVVSGGQLLLRAQAAANGELLWDVTRGTADADNVAIAVEDGNLVVADGEALTGIDGNSGAPGWQVNLPDGDVRMITDTGRVWTVSDTEDGGQAEVHSVYSGEVACGPTAVGSFPEWPMLVGARWMWADTEGRIVAVDAPDGSDEAPYGGDCTVAWLYDLPDDANAATPVVLAPELGQAYVADDWLHLTGLRLWDE